MTTTNDILTKLLNLDFNKYPYDQVNDLIRDLGKYIVLTNTINAGTVIARARVNCNFEIFSKKSDLSYKPADFNKSYLRASTPYKTMFYGAIVPPGLEKSELNNPMIVGSCEVSKLLRDDKIPDGEQIITFGKWRVTKDFQVASIVHHDKFTEQNSFIKKLNQEYKQFLVDYPTHAEKSLAICNFFADQFAKSETPNDFDYLLSAIYAERMTDGEKLAGVLYPSVRTEGQGLNVAISPFYADTHLQLEGVVQCSLYKKNNFVVSDNDADVNLVAGQDNFILKNITTKSHIGRDMAYKIINGDIKIKQN